MEDTIKSHSKLYRISLWAKERFPALNVFTSFLLGALTLTLVSTTTPASLREIFFLGLGFTFQFLLLRILDEHKDFEVDLINHKDRVLQKGIVSLAELRLVGWAAAFGTLALTVLVARDTVQGLVGWAIMSVWTALMTFEFFAKNWLRKHLLVYSVSHLFVLPLMIIWGASLFFKVSSWPISFIWCLGIVFVNALLYEVLRKSKGLEQEKNNEMTFSKWIGAKGTSTLTGAILTASFLGFIYWQKAYSGLTPLKVGVVTLPFVLMFFGLANYVRKTNKTSSQINEGLGALYTLSMYLVWIFLN